MFGLKESQDLENWAAHRHQEFPGVTPPPRPRPRPPGSSQVNELSVEVVSFSTLIYFLPKSTSFPPKKHRNAPLIPLIFLYITVTSKVTFQTR